MLTLRSPELDRILDPARLETLDRAAQRLGAFGERLSALKTSPATVRIVARLGRPQLSLRKPAPLNLARPDGVESAIPDQALARWADSPVKAAAGEDVISILDPIGFDPWTGGGVTAKRITGALRAIGDKPVTVQINSPGGDFFEGLAIYNALALHPRQVTVQVIGIAASAASVIAMAGDTVEIAKAGFLMIHNTQWLAIGDRNVMRETADIMQGFDDVTAGVYADRTGLDAKAVGKLMDAETWLGGAAAVAKGFADTLLAVDPAKDGESKTSALFRLEAAMARHGVPRAERRKLIKELGTPSAARDDPTPGAGATADVNGLLADLTSFRV